MSADLAVRQEAFLAAILDEAAPLPEGWGNSQAAGMVVYRGNYRGALMSTVGEIFERTARYVGEGPFRRASMHHLIKHPPTGWTIDEAGKGFDATCAELFGNNPEVAELAWLEWRMRDLATAPDAAVFTAQDFAEASAGFGDEEWGALTLSIQPRAAAKMVGHDLDALWRRLSEDAQGAVSASEVRLAAPQSCLTWREGERPTFLMVEADHAAIFAAAQDGANYGELIGALLDGDEEPDPRAIENAAMRAGAMLGLWLNQGLVTGISA